MNYILYLEELPIGNYNCIIRESNYENITSLLSEPDFNPEHLFIANTIPNDFYNLVSTITLDSIKHPMMYNILLKLSNMRNLSTIKLTSCDIYSVKDNILYSADLKELLVFPYRYAKKDIIIPDETEIINTRIPFLHNTETITVSASLLPNLSPTCYYDGLGNTSTLYVKTNGGVLSFQLPAVHGMHRQFLNAINDIVNPPYRTVPTDRLKAMTSIFYYCEHEDVETKCEIAFACFINEPNEESEYYKYLKRYSFRYAANLLEQGLENKCIQFMKLNLISSQKLKDLSSLAADENMIVVSAYISNLLHQNGIKRQSFKL